MLQIENGVEPPVAVWKALVSGDDVALPADLLIFLSSAQCVVRALVPGGLLEDVDKEKFGVPFRNEDAILLAVLVLALYPTSNAGVLVRYEAQNNTPFLVSGSSSSMVCWPRFSLNDMSLMLVTSIEYEAMRSLTNR